MIYIEQWQSTYLFQIHMKYLLKLTISWAIKQVLWNFKQTNNISDTLQLSKKSIF